MDALEKLRNILKANRSVTCYYVSRETLTETVEQMEAMQAQLPEDMKHCTILFRECEQGHGWLTATNWVQHGCPTCQIQRLQQDKADLLAQLKDARREIGLLRGLEENLGPLRRLRDAMIEVLGLGCTVEATLPVSPEEMAGWTIMTVDPEETQ